MNSYFGSINDLVCVSPKGESFGRLMKIKQYATILMKKLIIITVERFKPLNFVFESVDFLPKTLHSKPPVKMSKVSARLMRINLCSVYKIKLNNYQRFEPVTSPTPINIPV